MKKSIILLIIGLFYGEILFGQQPVVFSTGLAKPAYIDEVLVRTGGVKLHAQAISLASAEKLHQRTYLDGLGRPLQQVNYNVGTATNPDLVSFMIYDVNGREKKQYLPYATATSRVYQTNPVAAQADFYATSNTAGKYAKDNAAYTESVFDNSPMNEVLSMGSVGTDWQLGTGKIKQVVLRTNTTSDEVRVFNTDGTSSGYYTSGTLNVSEGTDEEGHKIIVFSDQRGNAILQRQWVDETIKGSYKAYKDTYSIYHINGLLAMTLPPNVIDRMINNSWTLSSDDFDHNVYRYHYDKRGRMVGKKRPAEGWSYLVYDVLDRLCLVQTAEHRKANKWHFSKYDRLGRVVMSGILQDNTHTSRSSMQAYCETYDYLNPTVAFHESRGGLVENYTDVSFPQRTAFAIFEPLVVNYYDGYDSDNNGSANYSYIAQGLGSDEPVASTGQGQLTIVRNKQIGTSDWMIKVYFYDKKGNIIQEQSNNVTNAAVNSVHTNVFDFVGLLKRSINKKMIFSAQHTTDEQMTYDDAARLASVSHSYNGNAAITLGEYVYNELGQLVDKNLGKLGPGSYLQSVDLRYNIRGWLTGINNSDLSNDGYNEESNDLFGIDISYQGSSGTGNTAMYNGQVSAIRWRAKMSGHDYDNVARAYTYSYDKLGQLRSALFSGNNGAGWTYRNSAYDEKNISYDLNGNILSLERNNWSGAVASMDNLTYFYKASGGSDQLMKVVDANGGGGTYGFKGQSSDAEHYYFNGDGSLIQDKNKNATYTYNDLGKIDRVTLLNYSGRYIQYSYDGAGNCLGKQVVDNGGTVKTTSYVAGFVVVNNTLDYINTAEGRLRTTGGAGTYEYDIKDHLGNVRASFENQSGIAVMVKEYSFYAFGLVHSSSPVVSGAHREIAAGAIWDDDFGNDPDLFTMFFRQYDPVLGRFNGIDPMVEKYVELSVYNFAFNNPVSFSDPSGADPLGSWEEFEKVVRLFTAGVIYGREVAEVFARAMEQKYANKFGDMVGKMDEKKLWNNSRDELGRYAAQYVWENFTVKKKDDDDDKGWSLNEVQIIGSKNKASGWFDGLQTGLDVVGMTDIPILSQVAELGSGLISLSQGDYVGAGLSLGSMIPIGGKVFEAMKVGRKVSTLAMKAAKKLPTVFQKHHIIPNQVYKAFKSDLKAIGWKQNDMWNLKKLPTPFHGNHPAYNDFIMNEIYLLKQSGNLNLNSMQNLQQNMRLMIGDAYRSGGGLNQFFKF